MDCAAGVINPCPSTLQGTSANLFLTLINTLMASQCALGPEGRYPPDYGSRLKDGDEFDFIVVGSGSAGSVVASRLSDVDDWKVLVLEAGGYPSAMSEIPFMMLDMQDTTNDWQYKIEPSRTACMGLKDQVCRCPRGKGLGGSSLINAMMYLRGNRKDYDSWANAGNTGWDFDSVLPYFKMHEDNQGPCDPRFGKGGELGISRYTSDQPIRQSLADAYKELGYSDYHEEKPLGYLDGFLSIANGTRSSTGKAFLGKVKDRKNLLVAVNAHVAKLIIDEETKAVEGVEVKLNDKVLKIKSRKEVILSAGSINSPQILMNSGIGPEEDLKRLGIKVHKNLSVGKNLQDHMIYPAFFININDSAVNPRSPTQEIDDLYEFLIHRKGPLVEQEVSNFATFINVIDDSIYPDIQFLHLLHHKNDPHLLAMAHRGWNLPEEIVDAQIEHNKNSNNILIAPVLLKPKSRGEVLLRSADPFDKPFISLNAFDNCQEEDIETMIKGIKFLEKLIKTKPFQKLDAKLSDTYLQCENILKKDPYWYCAVRKLATTLYHPVGTCKMGPEHASTAVVDPRLKVYGIKGVRVIDGSIMPTITSCNTNGPIIMIGEKGAALIKEDWLEKHQHTEL